MMNHITPQQMLLPFEIRNNDYADCHSSYLKILGKSEEEVLENEANELSNNEIFNNAVICGFVFAICLISSLFYTLKHVSLPKTPRNFTHVMVGGAGLGLTLVISKYVLNKISRFKIDSVSLNNCSKNLDRKRLIRLKFTIGCIERLLQTETNVEEITDLHNALTHFQRSLPVNFNANGANNDT